MGANIIFYSLLKLRFGLFLLLSTTFLFACSGSSSSNDENSDLDELASDNFTLVTELLDNVIIPGYRDFSEETPALRSAITSYCAAIGGANEESTLEAAQTAWRSNMSLWQETLVYEIGPIAKNSNALSRIIYTPTAQTNSTTGFIDNGVENLAANSNYELGNASNSQRGLDALEYLLFDTAIDVSNESDRCAYAELLAEDLASNAQMALDSWVANDNAGKNEFLSLEDANATAQIKEIFEALFYVETDLKDIKLGAPTNLKSELCDADACPELVEHPLSMSSFESIDANLLALRKLVTGLDEGQGFQNVFISVDMQDLSDAFIANIDSARNLINSQTTTFYAQMRSIEDNLPMAAVNCINASADPNMVSSDLGACTLHGKVKVLTDFLKTDLTAVINLTPPSSVQGDGD